MKKILSKDILSFFKVESISYQCNNNLLNEYIIASIFNPIEKGLYFFLGDEVPSSISNSALILRMGNSVTLKNENIGIYITQDPQLIFYQLLSSLYGTHSNGEISNSAIIHPEAKIGDNVQIDHFSIIGKAVIGDNVIIRSHCYVNDNSFIQGNRKKSSD